MKQFRWRAIVGLVSAWLMLAALMPIGVSAQGRGNGVANGFRISPVRTEYNIDKGKSVTLTVTIENLTDAPTTATPIINDFVASDKEDGEPLLILDNNTAAPRNSFKSLVKLPAAVQLGARQKKDVPFTIAVPANAGSGGYYGAIRFLPSGTGPGDSNVGLTASVGSIVLVTVPGSLTQKLALVSLGAGIKDVPRSFITSGNNLTVITRLKNTGDIHVKPFGKVLVKDMFGKTIKEFEFNSKEPRDNVLPDSTRKFVDDLPKRRWFGRYTIEANIGFAQGSGDLISATATFWYLPDWFLVVLLILLVALATGIYFLVRLIRSKRKRRASRRR